MTGQIYWRAHGNEQNHFDRRWERQRWSFTVDVGGSHLRQAFDYGEEYFNILLTTLEY